MTAIKEKIQYEREKCNKLQEQIIKVGGRFDTSLVTLDAYLQVIKDILVKNNFITEDEFEFEYLKKDQIVLKKLLDVLREIKKKQVKKIILPDMIPPKNLKVVKS